MRLVSYATSAGHRLGVEAADGRIWSSRALGADLPATMDELLAGGGDALGALRLAADRAASADRAADVDPASRLAPVPRPGKIAAVGLNYAEHAAEHDGEVEAPPEPMLFAKFPTSVIGDGDVIEWDPSLTDAVDLEAELAVVIGRTARRVSREKALDHVLGYTCLNDVSARDLQFGDKQFVRGKSLDTFCPMGPAIVTTDELGDAAGLGVRSFVNDRPIQAGTTADLIHDVRALVAFCSRAFTLEPGDVIATGTPSGVLYFREPRLMLHDGDVVRVEIDGIGSLTNTCREIDGDQG